MTGQNAAVLARLESGQGITSMEAYTDLGCTRLSARIKDLRDAGVPIVTIRETGINRDGRKISWARYRMGARA